MVREILEHIEQLKAELAALQPMDEANEQRLQKKIRLEWNYNSNHIEGNTLTYNETELLLIFDETRGSHDFREYEEMKGHDVALKMVEDLANDKERELTGSFIRELNQVILKQPFYKDAVTSDGQPTRRLIGVGKYKEHPNSVQLSNGEMFHYASPVETPIRMEELIEWYRSASANTDSHPVILAAELHYRFVLIHPFDDGNGRISRLLMNYHLLRNGHPPIIIKAEDKKHYLQALHDADTGNKNAFIQYIAEQLLWSYDISIKAAKGESVDEPSDWEKEIELLKKDTSSDLIVSVKKSQNIQQVWKTFFYPLLNKTKEKLNKIDEMFEVNAIEIKTHGVNDNNFHDLMLFQIIGLSDELEKVDISFTWHGYRYNGTNSFSMSVNVLSVSFYLSRYEINFHTPQLKSKQFLYSQGLSSDGVELFIELIGKRIVDTIKSKLKN